MPNEESPSQNFLDSQPRFLDRNPGHEVEPTFEPNKDFKVDSVTSNPCPKENQRVSIISISQSNETVVSPMLASNGLRTTSTSEPNSLCPSCGKEAKLLCTRCRVQKYCSQTCQQNHWSTIHKRECVSIEGRTIIVDVHDDDNDKTNNNSTNDSPPSTQLAKSDNLNFFILKVQVALNSKVSPMIGYDYSRSVYYLINATNCKKSQLLDHTIRTTGDVQGSKAYFNAKIRARDLKLIIYLDQRHSNLGW